MSTFRFALHLLSLSVVFSSYDFVFKSNPLTPRALLISSDGNPIRQVATKAFTFCLFAKISSEAKANVVSLVSFSSKEAKNFNEILLEIDVRKNSTVLVIHDITATLNFVLPLDKWVHMCLSWNSTPGKIQLYVDGKFEKLPDSQFCFGCSIGGKGYFVLGQDQDGYDKDYDSKTGFQGRMTEFYFWDRVLTTEEMEDVRLCMPNTVHGQVISWNNASWGLYQNAFMLPSTSPCNTSQSECKTTCPNYHKTSLLDLETIDEKPYPHIISGTLEKNVPQIQEFSLCAWIYIEKDANCAPFSIKDNNKKQRVLLYFYETGEMELTIKKEERIVPNLNTTRDQWQHYCVTWSASTGEAQAFHNGKLQHVFHKYKTGLLLNAGYKLWTYPKQYANADCEDPTKGFACKITDIQWWDHVIQKEAFQAYSCSGSAPGNVFSWNEGQFRDAVRVNNSCPNHPKTSPLDHKDVKEKPQLYIVAATLKNKIPQLQEFSFCAWVFSEDNTFCAPLTIEDERVEYMSIVFKTDGEIEFTIRGISKLVPDHRTIRNEWQHYCVTWSGNSKEVQVFYRGGLKHTFHEFGSDSIIPAGHNLTAYQRQYKSADRRYPLKGFASKIMDIYWWDHVITKQEVNQAYSCSVSVGGNLYNWNEDGLKFLGISKQQ